MVASAGSRAHRVPSLPKYEVVEELGHGGMATVYRAHDKRLGRDVAVKLLHPHLRDSREIAHRFAAEAKAVAKLRHPNIVEVFDVSGEDETEQYLVVELVRGRTLRQILKDGPLPPEIGAAVAVELLAALLHAHEAGVVHRDVKPENVLVEHRPDGARTRDDDFDTPDTKRSGADPGDRVAVKLTDFGIAKLLDAQGVTSTGQVLGSPAHMAPEQIEGAEVDGRADVFGMGVLLYECIVGHLPFEGQNPAQVLRRVLDGLYAPAEREVPVIGKTFSAILDRALARDPSERFESAQAMRDALLAELERLEQDRPRAEIEAYLDDPLGWRAAHQARVTKRLCELGGAARRRGDAVAAAADYNRALAYAPNDPALLRIVATMHRAESRRRLAKRIVPLVGLAVVLGPAAFFVARAMRPGPGALVAVPGARPPQPSAPPRATASAPPSEGQPSKVPASKPAVAVLAPRSGAPQPRKVTRLMSGSLQPRFGVHMDLDGKPAGNPEGRYELPVDDKPHVLTFTCRDPKGAELCVARNLNVPAGDKDETHDVVLQILPARLLVEGPAGSSYSIDEMPGVVVAAGVAADIPMPSGSKFVTVYDRSDPTRRSPVTLRAGKVETLSFKSP